MIIDISKGEVNEVLPADTFVSKDGTAYAFCACADDSISISSIKDMGSLPKVSWWLKRRTSQVYLVLALTSEFGLKKKTYRVYLKN